MNRREKVLGFVVLVLVLAWLGSSWYGKYRDALAARNTAVADAKSRLADLNLALAEGRSAVRRLEEWQLRSLPPSRELALSLYKGWLLDEAKQAGLAVDDLKPSPRTTVSTAYSTIGYQMEASGPLSAVAAMLYEFYSSPYLHQITRLRLHRPPGEATLQMMLEVEALLLPGATATDALPEGKSDRLRLASVEDYQKSLGDRDLHAVYTGPTAPVAENASSASDASAQARFSASVPARGGLQAWINIPSTGETLHLSAGDPLNVGSFQGRIVAVEPRALVVQSGAKRLRVALGQPLSSGKEIEADTAESEGTSERRRSSPPG